jgi:ABC-type Mn2+/Zn2+ transport system ATPase subunit
MNVTWIYGPSGSGKTKTAMKMVEGENYYVKVLLTEINGKPWKVYYRMQKNVSLETSVPIDQQGYISTRTPSEANWIGVLSESGQTPQYPASFVTGNFVQTFYICAKGRM